MDNLKIGSFNLYNLVLPDQKYYENKKYNNSEYKKKINWIKNQVEVMGAHIIGFQEVFHKAALEAALKNTQFNSDDIFVLGETGESPVVGLASKFPVLGSPESIVDIPINIYNGIEGLSDDYKRFSRPVLKLKVAVDPKITITVFVSHLKSKRPKIADGENGDDFLVQAIGQTRSLLRRAVEALGLRYLLLKEMREKNSPVVLIGDLNDSTRSVTSNIIAGPLPWKFAPIHKKKEYWDKKLYSCFDIIAQRSFKKEWSTHIYNGHYEVLDHIYVSQEFFFRNRARIGNVEFVHVYDDHLQDDILSKDKLPKWHSDHGQVVSTISIK